MKRKEFFQLVLPLTDRLYRFAYVLIPDDLQAEQLVVDAMNAFLIKEKKILLKKNVNLSSKKEVQILRRTYFKGLLRYLGDIGARRASQLSEQMKLSIPEKYSAFYAVDPKIRFVITLRYEAQFRVEEIEEIIQVARYEVIEKIHNGRFLLLNDLNKEVSL